MANSELEAFHIERFLSSFGLRPEGEVEFRDTPDSRFRFEGSLTGLEHTMFFLRPSEGRIPEQHLSALQELAIEHARQLFRDAGGPALYVSPVMNDRGPTTKREAYELGARFAKVVRRNGWGGSRSALTFETWRTIREMHGYTVMPSVDGTDELWHPGGSGWVAEVSEQMIQRELDRKETRLGEYRRHADDVWLLLVNDIFRGGAPCEIGQAATSALYYSGFDRVFWYEVAGNRAFELSRQAGSAY